MFLYISAGVWDKVRILHKRVARDVHYGHLIIQSFVFFIKWMQSEQASKRKSELTIQEKNYEADKS